MDEFSQALVNTFPTLGVGGILAGILFYFYRNDRREWMERYERMSIRFEGLAKDFKIVVQDNTKAITIITERIGKREV
jgi:hypothetical protein